jgi:hypothetical protein
MIARIDALIRQLRAEFEAIRDDVGTPLYIREARLRAAESRATEERVYVLEDLEAEIQSVVTREELLRVERLAGESK